MSNVDDPVAFGLVGSLARPGGNITGLSATPGLGLSGKRLELLKETIPNVSRVAILWYPDNPGSVISKREYEAAAEPLGIKPQSLEMRDPTDLEQAFSAMKRDRAEVLVTINSPAVTGQLKRIVEFAAKSRCRRSTRRVAGRMLADSCPMVRAIPTCIGARPSM